MSQWSEQSFINISAEFLSVPFWAWNDTITIQGIDEKLNMLHDSGFGGAFVHPRPGLTNEYLSQDWFTLWHHALDTSKKLGMKLYIYDENTYPTGYAGGEIASALPDCAARSVKVYCLETYDELSALLDNPSLADDSKTPIRLYTARYSNDELCLIQREEMWQSPHVKQHNGPYVAILWQQPYASAWFGGFANPDILRPEVTQALLSTTYEAYYRHFKEDFGVNIPAIFSDEPSISPGSVHLEDKSAFPFSRYFAAQFHARCGYCLEDVMACISLNIPVLPCGKLAEQVRYDYYCTMRELWVENFARPVSEWCTAHGLAWTGHFLDEHWPYPTGCCSPAIMSMYEFLHWPGIDMLMSHLLKDTPKTAMLLPIKELSSVGNQLGKERLLCECYGAGGWDASITDFKRIGDWLAANGITFFNQHLTLHSKAGCRKYGHPQSFDQSEPWWQEFKELNPYFGRISYALSRGKAAPRVLVLHPTTSFFLQPLSQTKGDLLWHFEDMPKSIQEYVSLLQDLQEQHIEYDLGDEFLIENHGFIKDNCFCIGQCSYDTVIIPPLMQNMRRQTLALLQAAQTAQVSLLHMGHLPSFIDGTPCEISLANAKQVLSPAKYLSQQGFALIKTDEHGVALGVQRRMLENGSIYFIQNSGKLSVDFVLSTNCGTLFEMNAFTGNSKELHPEQIISLQAHYKLSLNANASILLHLVNSHTMPKAIPAKSPCLSCFEIVARAKSVRALQRNVLPLDYCTLTLRNSIYPDIHTIAVCDKVFHAYGFEQNPWDMSVQFRQRNLQRPIVNGEEGFSTAFNFLVKENAKDIPMSLAAERASLCQLYINDCFIPWDTEDNWLDQCLSVAHIGSAIHSGQNIAVLKYRKFSIYAEVQPIYILGDFYVQSDGDTFVLSEAQALAKGALSQQGYPFYGQRVAYEYSVSIQALPQKALLAVPKYDATALSVIVNDTYCTQAGIGDGGFIDISAHVCQGENKIVLELSCSLKNLLGPHHTAQPVRGSAWPAAWRQAPIYGKPKPSQYDIISYGIYEDLVLLLQESPL